MSHLKDTSTWYVSVIYEHMTTPIGVESPTLASDSEVLRSYKLSHQGWSVGSPVLE